MDQFNKTLIELRLELSMIWLC